MIAYRTVDQVCGGIILFFGIFQFIPQIRKRASYTDSIAFSAASMSSLTMSTSTEALGSSPSIPTSQQVSSQRRLLLPSVAFVAEQS